MPKSKRNIVIATPKGQIYTYKSKNGTTVARLDWEPQFKPDKERSFENAQEFVDSECLRYMTSLTPRRSGALIKSATLGTTIGSGEIEYLSPYARYQYYGNVMTGKAPKQVTDRKLQYAGAPNRGAKWFERMKAGHKNTILKGAADYASGRKK